MNKAKQSNKNLRIPLSFEQTIAAALETPPERKPKKKAKRGGTK